MFGQLLNLFLAPFLQLLLGVLRAFLEGLGL